MLSSHYHSSQVIVMIVISQDIEVCSGNRVDRRKRFDSQKFVNDQHNLF